MSPETPQNTEAQVHVPTLDPERRARLLELGLTEIDLAYMGARQRAMVEEVLDAVFAAARAA